MLVKKSITHVSILILLCLGVFSSTISAQSMEEGLFKDLKWRNIGPANMAGRVTDIEAVDSDFATVYVGAASGGVFKSTNAGTTWEPIFDKYGSGNIGDIAVYQKDPNIVWVGTGESCVRNSVGWGDGVYKSTDGGETFENMGLKESHHIGEVIIHPKNPDIVYVASQGHLWGHTGEHGLFKTEDGGKTWKKLTNGLPDDGKTGCTDVKMDPKNSNVLYAAFWERLRRPYRFDSGGPNSGIYKSTNGGKSWKKLTKGLPEGDTGKIGISIYQKNPKIIVAIVEHGFQPPLRLEDRTPNPEYEDMTKLGTGIYRSENAGKSWKFISRYNNRPFYYSHIYINPADDQLVYVLAGSAGISVDGGKTFERTMQGISGDFHALWVDPNNKDFFYVGNDKGSYKTYDNGRTFEMFDNMDIGQFYAVTVDNRDPYWVYGGLQDNGNWGGPSNSRDWNGILNDHWFKFHSGDGFHTTADPNDWRTIYTESQGGNIRRLDAVFRQVGKSITPNPTTVTNFGELFPTSGENNLRRLPENFRFNWSSPLILSPHNSNTVYFGGNYLFKSIDRGDTWKIISSDLSTQDPVKTDPESGGLTRDVTSAETHCTLITIAESPITPGLIWAGTDDGNVHITRNDGKLWTNVRRNIREVPEGLWCSRIEASRYDEGTAYVSFDGHRSDNFVPWIFKTTDFGQTWTKISGGLPDGFPVYVIKEDVKNPNLLFAGTEFGAFASINGGGTWEKLMNGLPVVAVHDLVIHPREGDLIAATHGRSIWILDDITPLQQLNEDVLASDSYLFENKIATTWKGISRGATRGHKLFMGRNPLTIQHQPPGNSPRELQNSAAINYYVKSEDAGEILLEVMDLEKKFNFSKKITAEAGINRFYWNMRFNPPPMTPEMRDQANQRRPQFGGRGFRNQGQAAEPGTYIVKLTINGRVLTGTLAIREDPGLNSRN